MYLYNLIFRGTICTDRDEDRDGQVEFDETTKIDLVIGDMFLFNFSHLNIR